MMRKVRVDVNLPFKKYHELCRVARSSYYVDQMNAAKKMLKNSF